MAKIRITKAPSGGTQKVRISSLPNQIAPSFNSGNMSTPKFEVAKTLKPVPRDQANIEAEKGETVLVPNKEGLPAHYNIGGNRHSNGGTPLNVTKDSFVFSDTRKLRIKDPEILAEFGKSKGSYTPADLAKKYDINKFRKILQDPDSDPIMVSTAEKMIANYNLKLAKLALIQESKKGFPQGIPEAAMPYMATYNIDPDQVLPLKQKTEDIGYEDVTPQAKWGGNLPKAQNGINIDNLIADIEKKKKEEAARQKAQAATYQAKQLAQQKEAAAFYKQQEIRKLENELKPLLQFIGKGQGYGTVETRYSENMPKLYPLLKRYKELTGKTSPVAAPKSQPPTAAPQWKQNPDGSWTQTASTQPVIAAPPAMPATMPQDSANVSNLFQASMKNAPGTQSYTAPVVSTAPTSTDSAAVSYLTNQGYSPEQIQQILSAKKYGGAYKMQEGGAPLTPAQIAVMSKMKPAGKTTVKKPKGASPTVSPYGDADTEAFLKTFGVAPEDMVYDPIGHQSKSTLGLTDAQVYDKWRKGNPKFLAEFEKEGKKFDPNNPADMQAYEKYHKDYTYNGIYNALKKKGVKDDVAKQKAEQTANKLSFVDQPGVVNAADQKWGNYHRTRREFNFNEPNVVEEVVKEAKKPVSITEPGPKVGPAAQYTKAPATAPWWIQDVINTASAAGTRLGLKKYLPWAPPVHLETPRPTFFDPTRELAANAEQMAIGTQGAGLFAGPQAYNARFSQIQGAGARNAANILSNYHNKNVGVANQFENLRTGIMNKEAMMNADSAHRLYDQTTVANQQFDNAKRQANNELRASYINAITNRAQTQTLNELYPHYKVDPMSGGFTMWDKGSDFLPGRGNQTLAEQAADINAAASQAGWTTDQMLNYLGKGAKQDRTQDRLYEYEDNPYALNADYLRQRNAVVPTMGNYGYEE